MTGDRPSRRAFLRRGAAVALPVGPRRLPVPRGRARVDESGARTAYGHPPRPRRRPRESAPRIGVRRPVRRVRRRRRCRGQPGRLRAHRRRPGAGRRRRHAGVRPGGHLPGELAPRRGRLERCPGRRVARRDEPGPRQTRRRHRSPVPPVPRRQRLPVRGIHAGLPRVRRRRRDAGVLPGDFAVRDLRVRGTMPDESLPGNPAAFRFDVRDEAASGTVKNVVATDGGHDGGQRRRPLRRRRHAGTLEFVDCEVSNFPNNGLYASAPGRDDEACEAGTARSTSAAGATRTTTSPTSASARPTRRRGTSPSSSTSARPPTPAR